MKNFLTNVIRLVFQAVALFFRHKVSVSVQCSKRIKTIRKCDISAVRITIKRG